MPKPEWVQNRKSLEEALRHLEELFDEDSGLDAIDALHASDEAAARAHGDPMAYIRGKMAYLRGKVVRSIERRVIPDGHGQGASTTAGGSSQGRRG